MALYIVVVPLRVHCRMSVPIVQKFLESCGIIEPKFEWKVALVSIESLHKPNVWKYMGGKGRVGRDTRCGEREKVN